MSLDGQEFIRAWCQRLSFPLYRQLLTGKHTIPHESPPMHLETLPDSRGHQCAGQLCSLALTVSAKHLAVRLRSQR